MNTMFNLTDRFGPRLVNSPQFRRAGEWAVKQLGDWGISNPHLEKWSTAGGRGGAIPSWEITGYSGAMVEPTYMPIIGYPQAWSGGTNGPITGDAIMASIQTPADLEKWHGKLTGKIVLTAPLQELAFPSTPLGRRYTDEELKELEPEIIPTGGGRGGRGGFPGQNAALAAMTPEERTAFPGEAGQVLGGGRRSADDYRQCARTERDGVCEQRVPANGRSDEESSVDCDYGGELQPRRAAAGA